MHHFSLRQVFLGLGALWLLALATEGWLVIDGRTGAMVAQQTLTQKRREAGRLAALDPAPTAAQTASLEAELTAADDVLARLQAELADDQGAAAHLAGTSGATESRAEEFPDAGDLVRDLHEQARHAGISVRPEERFGLAAAGREAGAPAAIAVHRRQRQATVFLIRELFAAHPAQLISVQCARPHGSISSGASARLPKGEAAARAGDFFDFDLQKSVREAGVIETAPIRLTFTGRTATLRQFLNQLSAGNPLVAISDVAVESAATTAPLHREKSSGAEAVVLMMQPAFSRFVVTAEFCELAMPPAAETKETPAEAVPAAAQHLRSVWPEPAPQKRGRGWIYEVFTPPSLFYDPRSRAFAAIPAEEATLATPENMPLDLQLLQVRKRPFRLRMVGFAGGAKDLRGIFADTTTGKTVMGREGDRLAGHRVWLRHLGLDRAGSGGKGTREPAVTATVIDEGTGEEIILTTRGPSPAGAPLGLFASRKAPALRRELQEGDSAVFEEVRYCVERVELEPPLAVVACVRADGAKATGRALILQMSPDAVRGAPALTTTGQIGRDSPTTP